MHTLIFSDNPTLADTLRLVLGRVGHECPAENLFAFDKATSELTLRSDGSVSVIVALGKNVQAALRAIYQIRLLTTGLILAVGPKDAGLILEAVHAGADDYVDESLVEDELPRSVARQCAARGLTGPEGQLILVMAGSGGCGRSQIATNLSVAMAQIQAKSCLVELDMCGGNCASMLNLKPRHTILDLCRHSGKLDRMTLEKTLITHDSGVHLLPAPIDVVRPDSINVDFIDRLIRETRSMFPNVVLDYQDLWNVELLKRLSPHNALILLVTHLDFNSVCNTSRVLAHLDRLGFDRQRVQIVVNRHGEPGDVAAKKIEQTLSIRISHSIPDDPRTVHRSINSGIPYVIESPSSPISKALISMADALAGRSVRCSTDSAGRSVTAAERWSHWHSLLDFRSVLSRLV